MMPRTKVPMPEPGRWEFKNCDRFMGILLSKPKPKAPIVEKPERPAKVQANTAKAPLAPSLTLSPLLGFGCQILPGESPSGDPRAHGRETVAEVDPKVWTVL